jgi:hypothetical protein
MQGHEETISHDFGERVSISDDDCLMYHLVYYARII